MNKEHAVAGVILSVVAIAIFVGAMVGLSTYRNDGHPLAPSQIWIEHVHLEHGVTCYWGRSRGLSCIKLDIPVEVTNLKVQRMDWDGSSLKPRYW